ncbi:Lon family ATP-dependent protease [Tumebacillus permanentifrigoris]|uniref:endopeptidase La n=1 Tax=Tumebacillus permanentifrigoris TaxID=378543 RepID=A0A316DF14_9BACL|nr:Lon family ATP-dependent protease [Tumebacillus permanentifrigoris]PWK16545.1 ATP-dependent Lon protease [Tumebacillus permanentifrigoris]
MIKKLLTKLNRIPGSKLHEKLENEDAVRRQVTALFGVLSSIHGPDKLVLRAGKLDSLSLMRSSNVEDRVLALQRIVFENPGLEERPSPERIPEILNEVEEALADFIARKSVEEDIERKVNDRMQEKHDEYLKEIRQQLIKEQAGPENAQTLKKYARLEKLETVKLSKSMFEAVRPQEMSQIVGQEQSKRALLSKLASPFPQHIIIYGPPGVGKTTAARIALQEAARLASTPFEATAPFIEVDGTTLRWDPRDITNPLLGSVHDPIYQGARRDFADSATPEPKPGLVTEAHGGILFIDEIGELDAMLQNKLLKVLEDKRVSFDSPYYDPDDTNVPKYIKKLFEEGAPADFVLIGATTRDPSEINPALRSRCAEIFFEPLIPEQVETIVMEAAERLHVRLDAAVAKTIARYTIEGRKAVNLLADAHGLAVYRSGGTAEDEVEISAKDIDEVLRMNRMVPYVKDRETVQSEVGKIYGLGVAGFLGSVLEIEAVAYQASEAGKGRMRFNDTAGSMAKDSVFNAAAVLRRITGKDLQDYDIHVNVVGGGRIDGPSAGVAITMAIYSALTGKAIPQNLAITGEVSIQGKVKPVGGVFEKIFGARQAGVSRVLVPYDNRRDVPGDLTDVEVHCVQTIDEVLALVFAEAGETIIAS